MRASSILLVIFVASLPSAAPAATMVERALDSLQWRRPLPQGNDLYSAAYGNGRTVIVGRRGAMLTSTNGVHWEVRNDERFQDLLKVIYANGQFVAVGINGGIFISADGLNWVSRQQESTDHLCSVAYGNGTWVVGAWQTARVYTSTDNGETWLPGTPMAPASAPDIAFGAGRFVTAYGYTSTDGISWTHVILPGATLSFNSVVYGNDLFAVGGNSYSATSPDGLTWTNTIGHGFSGETAAGAGIFVRLQGTGGSRYNRVMSQEILYSTDGLSWTPVYYINNTLYGVAHAGDQFIAVGNNGVLLTSTNGSNWTQRVFATDNNFRALAYGKGRYVAGGNDGVVAFSDDGLHWNLRDTLGGRDMQGVVYAQGRFTAAAGNDIFVSQNGEIWGRQAGGAADLLNIVYLGDRYIAVGDVGTVVTSSNGLSWTWRTVTNRIRLQGIAYGKGLYVITGMGGTILTSADAVNWTTQSSPTNVYLQTATYGNGRFVAAGTRGVIVTSDNGTNWSVQQTPAGWIEFEHITFGAGHFVVVGEDGTLVSSTNGVNWTSHYTGSHNNLRCVDYAQGAFMIVGNNDLIFQSAQVQPLLSIKPVSVGDMELRIRAMPGLLYRVQGSSNLTSWSDLFSYQSDQAETLFTDSEASESARRFYRVTFEP